MGEQSVQSKLEGQQRRVFMRHLLNDLRALEQILADEMMQDSGVRISWDTVLTNRTSSAPAHARG